jgi:PsbN protein
MEALKVTAHAAGTLTPVPAPRQLSPNGSQQHQLPALSVAITVLAVLLGLTGLGIYLAFGPPSKGLTDPFDDHDD